MKNWGLCGPSGGVISGSGCKLQHYNKYVGMITKSVPGLGTGSDQKEGDVSDPVSLAVCP